MKTPNVLIIQTDQQSWWTLSCYGGVLHDTPHVDRLAREGARFDNFFTNSAVCTPSRGCFVTGRYPHCHGAYSNNVPLNRDEVTFAHVLQNAEYRTGYAGKWHLDGMPRPGWLHPERSMGFEDCRFMFNRGHWQKIEDMPMKDTSPMVHHYKVMGDESTYTTDWLTDKTIDFLRQERTHPFCYMLSFPDPHDPFDVRPPYDMMYRPEDMPIPASFSEEDLPDWAAQARENERYALGRSDREDVLRQHKAKYLGEVKLIDECVGRLLNTLEEQDILDNTVVIFTTDHGEYMGEHGLGTKNKLYETAYRIPLVIRWPEKIAAGTVIDRVVSIVDFQQTLLGLLDVPACGREQGRDASPLLRGEQVDWTDEAFLYHASHTKAGIFTREFELAYVKDCDAILFDRQNDPEQTGNVFANSEYQDVVQELTGRIVRHHVEFDSPAAEWLQELGAPHTL